MNNISLGVSQSFFPLMVLRGAPGCGVPGVPGVSQLLDSGLNGVRTWMAPHQKKGSAWDGMAGQPH